MGRKHTHTQYCIQNTRRESFATHLTGIIYSIHQYQRYLYICVCVCVFVCVVISSFLDACLHLPVSVGRASRGHTIVFFLFQVVGRNNVRSTQQYSSSTINSALKSTSYFSRWIVLLYSIIVERSQHIYARREIYIHHVYCTVQVCTRTRFSVPTVYVLTLQNRFVKRYVRVMTAVYVRWHLPAAVLPRPSS